MTLLSDIRNEAFPFGANMLPDGRTRFRIWMPQQEKILHGTRLTPRLVLPDQGKTLPMQALGQGWYQLDTHTPHATRYAYDIADPKSQALSWLRVPDPMSYWQENTVTGFSKVLDPDALDWSREPPGWQGTAQEDLIIYELHVGTFTPEGTLHAAREKLAYLQNLGVTAIELMPLGGVAATYDWGYDEVLKSAIHTPYGTPQALAAFVSDAHRHNLSVILDVIDNHYGPVDNLNEVHTPEFWGFDSYPQASDHKTDAQNDTPWGPAIDLSKWEIRAFLSQKNLWWQKTYHLDGLRRDAVHELRDTLHEQNPARPHYLQEIFKQAKSLGHAQGKNINIILEYERNRPSVLFAEPECRQHPAYGNAQWADDFHSTVRCLLFQENLAVGYADKGYYIPYSRDPMGTLAEILTKGFALSLNTKRSAQLTDADRKTAFDPRRSVIFTRNHDQVGNTPQGERIETLLEGDPLRAQKLAFDRTILMLTPMIPMLFMGQERALETPFPFFATWADEAMRETVQEGRKSEFPHFDDFADPVSVETVESARLPWPDNAESNPVFQSFRDLIAHRKAHIMPHLASGITHATADLFAKSGLHVSWQFGDGAAYSMTFNAGNTPIALPAPDLLGQGANGDITRLPAYSPHGVLTPWEIRTSQNILRPGTKPRHGNKSLTLGMT